VVVVHGTARRTQQLRNTWTPFSEQHQAVIVTPLFPAGINGPDDLDSYKFIQDHGIRFDQILFRLLDEVAARWRLDVSRFYLAGHSGGGQYTDRMLLLHPALQDLGVLWHRAVQAERRSFCRLRRRAE
jgi:poly(3-hydroxybutyrate) depolymerase